MTDLILKITDPYERQARLYPALLTASPSLAMALTLIAKDMAFLSRTVPLLVSCGLFFLVASLARRAGKRIESKLFQRWGGKPSTQLLRHRDPLIDPVTKTRYHGILAKGIKRSFPKPQDESRDPMGADEIYGSSILWLLEQTRDTKRFTLLLKENISYGFHRNLLGLKPLALGITLLTITALLYVRGTLSLQVPFVDFTLLGSFGAPTWGALCFSMGMLVFWIFFLTEAVIKRHAFTYAERLLQSSEMLKMPK